MIEMAQTMNLSTQQQALSGAALLRPTRLQKPFVARPCTVMAVAHQVGIRVILNSQQNQGTTAEFALPLWLTYVSEHFKIRNCLIAVITVIRMVFQQNSCLRSDIKLFWCRAPAMSS